MMVALLLAKYLADSQWAAVMATATLQLQLQLPKAHLAADAEAHEKFIWRGLGWPRMIWQIQLFKYPTRYFGYFCIFGNVDVAVVCTVSVFSLPVKGAVYLWVAFVA